MNVKASQLRPEFNHQCIHPTLCDKLIESSALISHLSVLNALMKLSKHVIQVGNFLVSMRIHSNQDQTHTYTRSNMVEKPIGILSRIVVFVRLWNAMFKVLRDFSDDFSLSLSLFFFTLGPLSYLQFD